MNVYFDFDDEVDESSRRATQELFAEWNLQEVHGALRVEKLAGGASNVNLRISGEEHDWALRLCDPHNERWAVDRKASIHVQEDAAAMGLAPRVIARKLPEGHYLSEFLTGTTVDSDLVRQANLVTPIARTLAELNVGTTTGRVFSPFFDLGTFLEFGDGDDVGMAQDLTYELAAIKRIQSLFETREVPRGFCHSDLVPQNFILLPDGKLKLVDFDYAGMGWIAFELASFACQAQLDPSESMEFFSAYDPDLDEGQVARVELMRVIAGLREAFWAYMAEPFLSDSTKPLDGWTYRGYAENNLAQAHGVLESGGGLEQYLRAARQVRPGALF